jgi:hypothetical protein
MCHEIDRAPVSNGSAIYWFDADDRYIDGEGSNDLAVNVAGTFYGSYHGGHYGSTTFYLDGAETDLLTGDAIFTARELRIAHEGRLTAGIAINSTMTYADDGNKIDMRLIADALVTTDVHILMSGCYPDMSTINGSSIPATSTDDDISTNHYLSFASSDGAKKLCGILDYLTINGASAVGLYTHAINTGAGGYCKGYVSVPDVTLTSMAFGVVWAL